MKTPVSRCQRPLGLHSPYSWLLIWWYGGDSDEELQLQCLLPVAQRRPPTLPVCYHGPVMMGNLLNLSEREARQRASASKAERTEGSGGKEGVCKKPCLSGEAGGPAGR